MNREQAEKLLAALIFDDLDDASKAKLLAYLQTDDELRDRLADMRMAAKLACDAVKDGPDPVLSERRLAKLRQLAKPAATEVRIFTIRRFLAAAAVLTFGFVFMGLLMPSLSRRSYQSAVEAKKARVWASALEQRLEADSGQPVPAVQPSSKEMPQTRRFRIGSRPTDRSDEASDSAVSSGGGVMGGMGGMGGYGGAGQPGVVVSRAPVTTDRYSTGITNGQSVLNYEVARSGSADASRRQSLPREPMTARAPESSREFRTKSMITENVLPEQVMAEVGGKSYTDQPSSGPVPTDGRVASAKRSGGPVDNEEMRRELVSIEAAEAGKDNRVPFVWSGTITPKKPAVPMLTPPTGESVASSDRKAGQESELRVARETEAGKRVPAMGDVPIVGGLFRKDISEGKQDLSYRAVDELRARAETPSTAAPSEPEAVRLRTNNEPVDLGDMPLDMRDASVPYSEEVTYPKNWREINGDKVGIVPETEQAGVPLTSHFKVVPVNPWVMTDRDPLSTFALDVDTASYALCGRYIRGGFLPPVGAVRMEEFINAFDYAYPQRDDATFAVYAEGAPSPFAPEGQDLTLLKIAVKARTVGRDQRRAAHLVFVVDASASMGQADRLPAVQSALSLLVDKLSDVDRVTLITCANEARLHLEAVPAQQKDTIRQAINAIQAAGPTNLMAGLRLGYTMAHKAFVAGRINQVVLCSDGVANVGQTEAQAVLDEVAGDRKQGITLTCVGVGYGAYNDAFMEAMADRGDGRYVFLDSSEQARDTLVGQLAATLQTVAKDARIQVEFNPARVRRYRLIGYENRDIEDQRFRDDTVDAGEVGSGQCSTALYELELTAPSSTDSDTNLGTVFVRYRNADSAQVEEISRPLAGSIIRRRSVEQDPRFFLAAGAARFAEWLRQSEHAQHTALADVQRLLDNVSATLPLDRDVQDLAALAHQAENLPRASPAASQP